MKFDLLRFSRPPKINICYLIDRHIFLISNRDLSVKSIGCSVQIEKLSNIAYEVARSVMYI